MNTQLLRARIMFSSAIVRGLVGCFWGDINLLPMEVM